ncbi:hydroxyacid dehydrogenase [Ramlibacter tataouinensis]|uniref:hydroxyacid dehydrogenase n=1 Tax=Ramlibacter tataouinensis TaxID=94132 RepID=UPI0022F3BD5F|nr:hydroxyacid dehydrogenase [Ramlibacter tataouinensis]WBY03137.1 hydroxyacid dehydrogenase [Ramlibacter tataouinensis]
MPGRIVISEFMDEAAVSALRETFEVLYASDLVERPAELAEALRDADALIVRNRTRVNGELLASAGRLVAVGRLGVGLDNIDQAYCAGRGIAVLPAVGANASAVAEYVVGLAMALLRGFLFSSHQVASGEWPRARLACGREIAGKTLGLVGYGSVGQRVGELARAVGMRVMAFDPVLPPAHPAWRGATRCEELDDLFRAADVVSLHVPYTPQNASLVDERRLGLMKTGAVLVNTARGGIVDEAALARALRSGALAGAAVDVFENEPLPAGSALAGVPNLFLTPHIAGVTHESNERVSALIAQRIAEILRPT